MNFIIPYRNRKEHLNEFIRRFTSFDIDACFYIIHQINPGEFNRGALLNIGFLEVSKINPDGLIVFHDVDIYPAYWGSIQYDTKKGEIRHPCGHKGENIGGISCFRKEEFEKVNGFPNYWGWGIEDCTAMHRAKKCNIPIDETNFVALDDARCICSAHTRNTVKENESCRKNTALHDKEMQMGITDGLSNIEYKVSSFELAPKFTIMNVEFKIL